MNAPLKDFLSEPGVNEVCLWIRVLREALVGFLQAGWSYVCVSCFQPPLTCLVRLVSFQTSVEVLYRGGYCFEDSVILGYKNAPMGRRISTFRDNVVCPSPGPDFSSTKRSVPEEWYLQIHGCENLKTCIKNLMLLPRIEPRFLSRPAHSLITVPTELSRIQCFCRM
jgi:hypothetical protein